MTQVEIEWFRVLGGKYFDIKACRNYPICSVWIPQPDEEQIQFIYHVSVHYQGKNETASQDIILDVAPKSSEEGFAPNIPHESNSVPLGSARGPHQEQSPVIEDDKTTLPASGINLHPAVQSGTFLDYPDEARHAARNLATDQTRDFGQDKPGIGVRNGNNPLVGLTRSKMKLGPHMSLGNVQDGGLEPSPVSNVPPEDKSLETHSAKQFPLSKPQHITNYRLNFPLTRGHKKSLGGHHFGRTSPPRFIDKAPSDLEMEENEDADKILNAINSFSEMLNYPQPTSQTTVDQQDFQILSKGLDNMQKNVSKILKILADSEKLSPDQIRNGNAKHETGTGAISKQGDHQNPNTTSEGKVASQRKVNSTLMNTLNQMAKNYEDIQKMLNSLPIPTEDAPINAQDHSRGRDAKKRVKRIKRRVTSHESQYSRSPRKYAKKQIVGHSVNPDVENHFRQMWRKLGLKNGDRDRYDYDTSGDKNDKYQTYFGKNREHSESQRILKHIEGKNFQTRFIVTPEPDVLVRQDFVLMAPTPAFETTSSTLDEGQDLEGNGKASGDDRPIFRHADIEVYPILNNGTFSGSSLGVKGSPTSSPNLKGLPQTQPFQLHLQPFPENSETNTQTYLQSPGVLSQTGPLNINVSTERFALAITSTSSPKEPVFEQTSSSPIRQSYDYESKADDTDAFDENLLAQPTQREGWFHPNEIHVEYSTQSPFVQNQNFGFEVEEDNTDVLDDSTTTMQSEKFEINNFEQSILPNATTVTSGIDHVYHRLELNPNKILSTTSKTDGTDVGNKPPFQIYENPFPKRQAPSQTTTENSNKDIEMPTSKPYMYDGFIGQHIIPDSQHLNSSSTTVTKSDSEMVNVSISGMIKASNLKFLSEILHLLKEGDVSLPFLGDKKGNDVIIIKQKDFGIHFTGHSSGHDMSRFLKKLLKYHHPPGKASNGRTGKHEMHIQIIDVDGYHLSGHNKATRRKGNGGSGGIHHIHNSHATGLGSRYNNRSPEDDTEGITSWSSANEEDEDGAEEGAGDGPSDSRSDQYEVESIPNQREPERDSRARRDTDVDKNAEKTNQGEQIQAVDTASDGENTTPSWSEWSVWSTCSVTCGKGELIRERDCLPEDTEQPCIGSDKEEKECIIEACLEEEKAEKVVKEEGHSTEVECQYDKTKTVKEIHWLTPDGDKITTESTASSDKYKIVGNNLIVRGVQEDDGGTYRCVVTMEDGSSETADAELEVVTCEPNPCLHGGKCIEYDEGNGQLFKCSCPIEFEGQMCEKLAASNTAALALLFVILLGAAIAFGVGFIKKDKVGVFIFLRKMTKKAQSSRTPKTVLEMDKLSPNESLLSDAEIDLFREISREDFKNFKTSNSYSMFKGKKEKPEPQAVLDVEGIHKKGTEAKDGVSVVSDSVAGSDISKEMSSKKNKSSGVKTPAKKTSAASLSFPPSPSPAIKKVDQQKSSNVALSDHGQSNLKDVLSLVEYEESKPRSANLSTSLGHNPTSPPSSDKQQALLEDDKASATQRSSTPKAKRSLFAPAETTNHKDKGDILKVPQNVKDPTVNKEVKAHVPTNHKKQANAPKNMSTKSNLSPASPGSQNAMLTAKEIVKVTSAQALPDGKTQQGASSIKTKDTLSKSASEAKLQHVTSISSYHAAMAHFSSTEAANKDDFDQESAISDNWEPLQEFEGAKTDKDMIRTSTPTVQSDIKAGSSGVTAKQAASQKRRGSKFGYSGYVDRFTHLKE